MIRLVGHENVISCWKEAGRPLHPDTVIAINDIALDLSYSGLPDDWLVFLGKCRICNFEQTIICPAFNDIDNQECGNCGAMAMQEKEIPEWET